MIDKLHKAYDVIEHLADHPGGTDILTKAAGIDASEEFDNSGHSEDDFEIMRDYCVGNIKGSEKKKPKLKTLASLEPPKSENGGASSEAYSVFKLANLGLFLFAVAGLYLVGRRHEPALPKWMLSFLPNDSPILAEKVVFYKLPCSYEGS